ncbi:MAG: hypothetical protein WA192_03630 [Candidatus Acidiferrales bacterium]
MTQRGKLTDAYMVVPDLCNSTSIGWRDHDRGLHFHKRHETFCLTAAGLAIDSERFKAMGDGVMVEFANAADACDAALKMHKEAIIVRRQRGFGEFHVKITVSQGAFLRSPETQRWIGVLPTKAARIGLFARQDEIWIDDATLKSVIPHLGSLKAVADPLDKQGGAAAFKVLLRGFDGTSFSVHQLRRGSEQPSLQSDELKKEWHLLWTDVEVWVKQLANALEMKFKPRWLLGIGRSGAILAGMIAGNLKYKINHNHVPVSVVERTHKGNDYFLSSITEPEQRYSKDGDLSNPFRREGPSWALGPVLVVLGEAKTGGSVNSVRTWLQHRGFQAASIRTAALVARANVDYKYLRGDSALMPWQLVTGYDREWATYRALRR